MTNEQEKARELAKLLNAFADGKQFEFFDCNYNQWEPVGCTTVDDVCKLSYSLRIKPETKRVHLTMQDLIDRELSGKTISVIYNKMVSHILRYSDSKIYFSEKEIRDYEYLIDFTFLDGTPCYKESNNE